MIAEGRWADGGGGWKARNQFFHDLTIVFIEQGHCLQTAAESVGVLYAFHALFIAEIIELAISHFFKFCHIVFYCYLLHPN